MENLVDQSVFSSFHKMTGQSYCVQKALLALLCEIVCVHQYRGWWDCMSGSITLRKYCDGAGYQYQGYILILLTYCPDWSHPSSTLITFFCFQPTIRSSFHQPSEQTYTHAPLLWWSFPVNIWGRRGMASGGVCFLVPKLHKSQLWVCNVRLARLTLSQRCSDKFEAGNISQKECVQFLPTQDGQEVWFRWTNLKFFLSHCRLIIHYFLGIILLLLLTFYNCIYHLGFLMTILHS